MLELIRTKYNVIKTNSCQKIKNRGSDLKVFLFQKVFLNV